MTDAVFPDRMSALAAGGRFYLGNPCKHGHAPPVRNVGNKACRQCGIDQGQTRRALAPITGETDRERKRRLAYRQRNRDAVLEGKRAYRAANAEKERAYRQARKAERIASPEYQAKQQAKRDAAMQRDRDKAEQKRRAVEARERRSIEARQRHVLRDRAKQSRRRALMRGARGKAGLAQVELIRALQGGRCAYCGSSDDLHLDHVQPVKKGGQHVPSNLQFLCGWHNMSKKDQSDSEYRDRMGIPAATWWDVNVARAIMIV